MAYAGTGFVDTLFRSGALPVPMPMVPGIEVTGTVREVGPGITDLAPGMTVGAMLNDFGRGWRAGGYATVAVAHRSMVVPVPDGLDLTRVTAVLINGVTAWPALRNVAHRGRPLRGPGPVAGPAWPFATWVADHIDAFD